MANPIGERLLDGHPLLQFLLVNLNRFDKNLSFEVDGAVLSGNDLMSGKVYVFATPDKGHPDEEDSLQAMEGIQGMLEDWGFSLDPLFRNTPSGERVDGVRIWL